MLGVEQLLIEYLKPLLPQARIATDTPPNLLTALPMIKVVRIGGNRVFSLDKPSVDIDVFALTRLEATQLATDLDDILTYTLPTTIRGHVIGFAGTYGGPAWRGYDNTSVSRVGATYGLLVHRTSLSV